MCRQADYHYYFLNSSWITRSRKSCKPSEILFNLWVKLVSIHPSKGKESLIQEAPKSSIAAHLHESFLTTFSGVFFTKNTSWNYIVRKIHQNLSKIDWSSIETCTFSQPTPKPLLPSQIVEIAPFCGPSDNHHVVKRPCLCIRNCLQRSVDTYLRKQFHVFS